jgi:TetR/AcrR family tetracycline transcriptional repressor
MTSTERSNGETVDYRPKPQRGRPARLSRPAILDTGLALIKITGIENLTMRSLAQALNVAPMSLYSHVKDKDDLMAGIAQMVFARFSFNIDHSCNWQQQLQTWMNDVRAQLHEFPQLPQLYTYNERYSASLLNTTVVGIEILKKAGVPNNANLILTARSLMWFVLGYATLESFVKPRAQQASMELMFEQLSNLPDEQRAMLEPLKAFLMERDVNQIFEFGVNLMIDGIKYQQSQLEIAA